MGTSNSKSSISSDPAIDPLPYLTVDLPQHIVETKLPPGSGRLFRSYRIRSREGVTLVCKAAVVKYSAPTSSSSSAVRARSRASLLSAGSVSVGNTDVSISSSVINDDNDNYSDSAISVPTQMTSQQSSHVTKHPIIEKYEVELRRVCSLVGDPNTHPNVLPYQSVLIGPSTTLRDRSGSVIQSVYLLRQHGLMTLSDRLATRPFLNTAEKTWIAYQILRALQSIHDSGVCHGYVSSDNILVTSWGWVLLTDFATFKPTRIPDNDPSEFIYYFQRQIENDDHRENPCYLSPERLYNKSEQRKYEKTLDNESSLTNSMDIFSAGCVFIELFLNGEKAFDLGDLLEYKKNGSVPSLVRKLNKIESISIRAACKHMISLNPETRLSASSYISLLSRPLNEASSSNENKISTFPVSFERFLYPLIKQLRCEIISPDGRIALVARRFGDVVTELCQNEFAEQTKSYFIDVCGPNTFPRPEKSMMGSILPSTSKADGGHRSNISTEVNRWRNLVNETELLLTSLDQNSDLSKFMQDNSIKGFSPDSECHITMPSACDGTSKLQREQFFAQTDSHLVVLVQLVLSALRHTQQLSSRLVGLKLISDFAGFVNDEVRLQRMVPVIVRFLDDTEAIIRSTAIRILVSILENIRVFPPSDALLFPQFLFPRFDILINDPDVVVRVSLAECLAKIGHVAQRFLDINEAMKLHESLGDGSKVEGDKQGKNRNMLSEFPDHVAKLLDEEPNTPNSSISGGEKYSDEIDIVKGIGSMKLVENSYESELKSLRDTVSRWVVQITTNSTRYSNLPKTALLLHLSELCSFFGKERTLGTILPLVLAFLNDKRDWELRLLLWKQLPSACGIVGRLATEQFVVPCIETSLVDSEEKVISQALTCLRTIWRMKLLSRGLVLGARVKKILDLESETLKKSTTLSKDGVLIKCVPLLIHPSACIRQSVVDLVSAVCIGLQFPDDTVFVLPLLRPFIRFSLSSEQLRSSQQLSRSLLRPLDEKIFFAEVQSRYLNRGNKEDTNTSIPIERPTNIPTINTSNEDKIFDDILFVVGNNSISRAKHNILADTQQDVDEFSRSDLNSDKVDNQASSTAPYVGDNRTPISKINKYLELIKCYGQQNFQNIRPKRQLGSLHGRMNVEVDAASTSKAYSFIVPNQKFIELFATPLPDWYSDLREISSQNKELCSPLNACRSPSTIADLFGLSLMQPTHSMQYMRKWQGENIFMDDIQPGLEGISTERATQILSSKESLLLEAATRGEWCSTATLDPSLLETCLLLSKLQSLNIPPLSPRLGLLRETDGRAYSWHGPSTITPTESSQESSKKSSWMPSPDCIVASSSPSGEHTGAVSRLVVSQDQSFFISSSHDGTCRVWELRQIDNAVDLQSSLTYSGHKSDSANVRVNDACVVENSHSIVSGASNGTVHAWRVELVTSSKSKTREQPENNHWYYDTSRVCGSSLVRKIDTDEGEVLAVSHWNTNASSIIAFASQKGGIHTWDMRCAIEPFSLKLRPELGYLTSMAIGTDRNWLVAGTNQGYVAMWDIRYQMLVKLWHHSSRSTVSRLATSHTVLPQDRSDESNNRKPYIFVGCGKNEASIFDITNSTCRQCFRVLDHTSSYTNRNTLPTNMPELQEISYPSNPNNIISYAMRDRINGLNDSCQDEPNILSLMGRIGSTGRSYLITGGSDRCLRFWDFLSPSRCFTINGPLFDQSQQRYESVDLPSIEESSFSQKMFVCRTVAPPPTTDLGSKDLPHFFKQGLVRPVSAHRDAILDVKSIEHPKRCLLSGSRDGVVKIWR